MRLIGATYDKFSINPAFFAVKLAPLACGNIFMIALL